MIAPGEKNVGTMRAYLAAHGQDGVAHDQRAGAHALVATGGELVFGGDVAGKFGPYDAEHGRGALGDGPRRARDGLSHDVRRRTGGSTSRSARAART